MLSIGVRIAGGFAVALLILAVMSVLMGLRLSETAEDRRWVQHSLEVLKSKEQAVRLIRQAESMARGYQLTREESFRAQFDSTLLEVDQTLTELKRLVADNPSQQTFINVLMPLVKERFELMRSLFSIERIDANALVLRGAQVMERIQQLVDNFDANENQLLLQRQEQASAAEQLTMNLIRYGAVVALILTAFVAWLVIRSILRPVTALSAGAERVGSGDYSQPVTIDREDELGRLAVVFNAMAKEIFAREQALAEQDWLNTSLARFSRLTEGERDQKKLCARVLAEFAMLTNARQAVIYAPDPETPGVLLLQAAYASDTAPPRISVGHGLIGQCYRDGTGVVTDAVPEEYLRIHSALGQGRPAQLVVVPAIFEGSVKAILELASFREFTPVQLTLLRRFCDSFAVVLVTLAANRKTEELLREATAMSDRLREQQAEVQQANGELEQVNEELQQSNVEMEEKAMVMEEQRQLIERNNRDLETARVALEDKVQQLALSSRYKSEFLANMSHELRTPLNSLLILSKILAENNEGTLTPKQVERANTIHGAGNDLLELINDILDLAKIESGTVTAEVEQLRPADLAQQMKHAFGHVADNARLKFDVEVGADVPATMITDSRRLQQILRNLLSNAFKFTSKGGVTLKIERATSGWGSNSPTLAAADEVVVFRVIDTGIGVPLDRQQIVFEAFQQADAGTSRRYGGTGLGLSISRELTKLLQGVMTLESTIGVGSNFSLYLPRTLKAAPVTASASPTVMPAPVPPQASHGTAKLEAEPLSDDVGDDLLNRPDDDRSNLSAGDRILLVIEDDRSFASILADFAREKGFKVLIERSAQEAIRAARRFKPHAVTLDLLLKDSNGWAVLDRLKHDAELRHMPVHVISVDAQRERALMQGALSFLQKPVTREMLDAVLGETLALIDDPKRRLLVVEDDERQRNSITDLFANGDRDLDVVAVGTASAALTALESGRFHCMVADLGLPDMSGADLIASMQRKYGKRSPPVIIYTGKPLTRTEETELRAVSEAIIVKDAHSPERLLDEAALFLHYPPSRLPESKQHLLERARKDDPMLKGRSVLVVDDDVRNIFAITAGLESHQMRVRYAESGAGAIEILQGEETFDVVLMDVMMPEMDGFEAIRRIRRIPRHQDLPIIVLTAKAMSRAREQCVQAGASDYLSKPVDLDQLRSMLRVWLYKNR